MCVSRWHFLLRGYLWADAGVIRTPCQVWPSGGCWPRLKMRQSSYWVIRQIFLTVRWLLTPFENGTILLCYWRLRDQPFWLSCGCWPRLNIEQLHWVIGDWVGVNLQPFWHGIPPPTSFLGTVRAQEASLINFLFWSNCVELIYV